MYGVFHYSFCVCGSHLSKIYHFILGSAYPVTVYHPALLGKLSAFTHLPFTVTWSSPLTRSCCCLQPFCLRRRWMDGTVTSQRRDAAEQQCRRWGSCGWGNSKFPETEAWPSSDWMKPLWRMTVGLRLGTQVSELSSGKRGLKPWDYTGSMCALRRKGGLV